MKKLAGLLAGAMLMMAAGNAMAIPLDPNLVRPVVINPAALGENSLQTELDSMFGSGVVNANTDQLGVGMFHVSNPGSNVIAPQLKFEWTGSTSTQTVGIFGWNGTSTVDAQIFAGPHNKGDSATINWLTNTSGSIVTLNFNDSDIAIVSTINFAGISKDFFGFYFDVNGSDSNQRYYTVDSLNEGGESRVLGFQPNPSGALFSYEDGADFDYQDAGFFVESIAPVPEPGTMVLLGAGLLGLAIFGKRRMNKEA